MSNHHRDFERKRFCDDTAGGEPLYVRPPPAGRTHIFHVSHGGAYQQPRRLSLHMIDLGAVNPHMNDLGMIDPAPELPAADDFL